MYNTHNVLIPIYYALKSHKNPLKIKYGERRMGELGGGGGGGVEQHQYKLKQQQPSMGNFMLFAIFPLTHFIFVYFNL